MTKNNQKESKKADKTPEKSDVTSKRPVDPNTLEVVGTLDVDGERPIAAGEVQAPTSFQEDGERPIGASNLEYEHTYK